MTTALPFKRMMCRLFGHRWFKNNQPLLAEVSIYEDSEDYRFLCCWRCCVGVGQLQARDKRMTYGIQGAERGYENTGESQ